MHTGISRASRALKTIDQQLPLEKRTDQASAKWIADEASGRCADLCRNSRASRSLTLFLWRLRPTRGSGHSLASRRRVFVFVLR
jgi:hypothetical protein